MKHQTKFSHILEYVWLGLSILLLAFTIHHLFTKGFGSSKELLALLGISVVMYLFRRHLRKSQKD